MHLQQIFVATKKAAKDLTRGAHQASVLVATGLERYSAIQEDAATFDKVIVPDIAKAVGKSFGIQNLSPAKADAYGKRVLQAVAAAKNPMEAAGLLEQDSDTE